MSVTSLLHYYKANASDPADYKILYSAHDFVWDKVFVSTVY